MFEVVLMIGFLCAGICRLLPESEKEKAPGKDRPPSGRRRRDRTGKRRRPDQGLSRRAVNSSAGIGRPKKYPCMQWQFLSRSWSC